jgi:Na+-transporting methylmalonyl-CoA/oxaloacetate decarboxylase gamma subunit
MTKNELIGNIVFLILTLLIIIISYMSYEQKHPRPTKSQIIKNNIRWYNETSQ